MKFSTLNQTEYKDCNGSVISSDKVEYIAPYKYIVDGFYNWECGNCGSLESGRACGWSVSGQVLICPKCKKYNLLVKTNVDELNQWVGANLTLNDLKEKSKWYEDRIDQYVLKSSLANLLENFEKYKRASQDWDNALSVLRGIKYEKSKT